MICNLEGFEGLTMQAAVPSLFLALCASAWAQDSDPVRISATKLSAGSSVEISITDTSGKSIDRFKLVEGVDRKLVEQEPGRWTLKNCPAGSYSLLLASDQDLFEVHVAVHHGESKKVAVRLMEATISGVVVDDRGSAVGGLLVSSFWKAEGRCDDVEYKNWARTDGSGKFVLRTLPNTALYDPEFARTLPHFEHGGATPRVSVQVFADDDAPADLELIPEVRPTVLGANRYVFAAGGKRYFAPRALWSKRLAADDMPGKQHDAGTSKVALCSSSVKVPKGKAMAFTLAGEFYGMGGFMPYEPTWQFLSEGEDQLRDLPAGRLLVIVQSGPNEYPRYGSIEIGFGETRSLDLPKGDGQIEVSLEGADFSSETAVVYLARTAYIVPDEFAGRADSSLESEFSFELTRPQHRLVISGVSAGKYSVWIRANPSMSTTKPEARNVPVDELGELMKVMVMKANKQQYQPSLAKVEIASGKRTTVVFQEVPVKK